MVQIKPLFKVGKIKENNRIKIYNPDYSIWVGFIGMFIDAVTNVMKKCNSKLYMYIVPGCMDT